MTFEAQRIAIAEACPEKIRKSIDGANGNDYWEWFDGEEWQDCYNDDPLIDLNACIPLLGSDWDITCRNGYVRVTIYRPSEQFDGRSHGVSMENACHAICEAFLRAEGKWTEPVPSVKQ